MKCSYCGYEGVPEGAGWCPQCSKPVPLPPKARRTPTIDFAQYIREHTRDFTGREWVFGAIDDWLGNPTGSRIFLLTGKAGSGKTAIAARLVEFSNGSAVPPQDTRHLVPGFLDAYHFCVAQRPDLIKPQEFAQSVSLQMSHHPECASALLAVKERQPARGKFQIRVNVRQTTGQIQDGGRMVGVYIEHLHADSVQPEDAFTRLIRDPLVAYLEAHPTSQVVILVDALDEALRYSGSVSIVAMLTWADSLPRGARFVLTSRPTAEAVQDVRNAGAVELSLTTGEGLAYSLEEVTQYAERTLRQRVVLDGPQSSDLDPGSSARRVSYKAQGNFLSARKLLDRVEKASRITPEFLETLPSSLEAEYLDSLRHLIGEDLDAWEQKHEPILGTLAVAQRALKEHELAGILGRDRSQVRRALTVLLPYLDRDPAIPASWRDYTIKDFALTTFLLDEDDSEEFWCEEPVQHRRISQHLVGFSDDWSLCDAYSLEHAAYHLIRAGQADDLDLILNKAFSDAASQRFGWHMPFVRNLELALEAIEPERLARLCLDIIYGGRPNSLVNQRILYLLADQIRPALQKKGSPFGRAGSTRDGTIDETLDLLSQPVETAVRELARLLKTTSGSVRGFIALALGYTRSPLATPILLRAFQEEERHIAWCVADGLLDLDDQSIVPFLIELYDVPSAKWGLQIRILYVLGRMQAREARVLIPKGLKHPDKRARARAVDMLWLLSPIEGAEEILSQKLDVSQTTCAYGRKWDDEYLQRRLVTVIGRVGSVESLDRLQRFKSEYLPTRPRPATDEAKRARQRLEESLDEAICELLRRSGEMHG